MAFTVVTLLLLQISSGASASSRPSDCDAGEDVNTLLQTKASQSLETGTDLGLKGKVSEAQGTWRLGQANSWLQSLEAMAHKAPPERNMSQLHIIKTIVEDTLLPGLTEAHDFGQRQLDDSKTRIDNCISVADTGMANVSGLESKTLQAEETHKTCRVEEETKALDMTTKCAALARFLDDTVFPTIPNPPQLDTIRPILHTYKLLATELENLDSACNSSTTTHEGQVDVCNGDQATFESHFCEYRLGLETLKANSDSCYDDAKTTHDSLEAEVQEKVVKWKAEYKAVKKIVCYLNVWLGDGNLSTVNTSLPASCQDDAIDTSAMDAVYPVVPNAKVIDVSPVQQYPGTPGFLDRYKDVKSHNSEIASCAATSTTAARSKIQTIALGLNNLFVIQANGSLAQGKRKRINALSYPTEPLESIFASSVGSFMGIKKTDSKVITWGHDSHGTRTHAITNVEAAAISTDTTESSVFCIIKKADNMLDCWGWNMGGKYPQWDYFKTDTDDEYCTNMNDAQRSTDDNCKSQKPTVPVSKVAFHYNGGCALTLNDQTAYCFGHGSFNRNNPNAAIINNEPQGVKFVDIADTDTGFCGIVASNYTVLCWGSDQTPADPMFEIVSSRQTTCGLKVSDSTVVCWGGGHSAASRRVRDEFPTDVPMSTIVINEAIGCGARKSDGKLQCWGDVIMENRGYESYDWEIPDVTVMVP